MNLALDTNEGLVIAVRARMVAQRIHDFYCPAVPCGEPTEAVIPLGFRFLWPCGYAKGITNDVNGLEAVEAYWGLGKDAP